MDVGWSGRSKTPPAGWKPAPQETVAIPRLFARGFGGGWGFADFFEVLLDVLLVDQRDFVAVDYVNDNIDLRAKSKAVDGVPDVVLQYIANALVDFVLRRNNASETQHDDK